MKKAKEPYIFVVDDDLIYQEVIRHELENKGFMKVEFYSSGKGCLNNIHKMPAIVLLDHNLEGEMTGLQVLKSIKAFDTGIQVIMLSSEEKIEIAAESMKYGTYDYVIKNDFTMMRISALIKRISKWNDILAENRRFRKARTYLTTGMGAAIVALVILGLLI